MLSSKNYDLTSDDDKMLYAYIQRLKTTIADQERQIEELRATVAALLAPERH